MPNLKLLYDNLKRIMGILPSALRRRIISLFFSMTVLGIVELASIMAITGFFSVIYSPEIYINSSVMQTLIRHYPKLGILTADKRLFVLCGCFIPIALIVLKNILSAYVAWKSSMASERVASYIGMNIITRYLYMPYDWHLSAQSSEALTAMQRRFNLGQMLLQILSVYSNLITVCLLFSGLMIYSPGVTISAVLFMLMTSFLTVHLLRRRIDMASSQAADAQQKENTASMTAMGGVREILIYQQQRVFLKTIDDQIAAGMKPRTFLGISSSIPSWTLESSGFFLIWLSMFLLVFAKNADLPEITTTVAFLTLTAWRVLPSLNRVVGSTVSIRSLQGTAMPCLEYFEKLRASSPLAAIEADKNFKLKDSIVFDHVYYHYPEAQNDALSDICCVIPAGGMVGLIGRSGAGKSTFINILNGLLTPTKGNLLVSGKCLESGELAAYRQKVGYVPQNPYLISGTIAQNVAFSDWGKELDEEMVRKSCRAAAIDFLGEDCQDIHRPVSAGGSGLSGGQLQRVSIARALYTEPDVLIFDEATSALDQASEAIVQEALFENKGKRICIIAAHRLSTLAICDLVIWLENGKIHAQGDPQELLKEYQDSQVHTENPQP